MNFKQFLNETISVYVSEYEPEKSIDDIDQLASWLACQQLTSVPEITQAKHFCNELLMPDGDAFNKPSGLINFYHIGIAQQALPKILSAIKYYCGEAGFTCGNPEHDKSNLFQGEPVIRIPVSKTSTPQKNKLTDANMANELAYHIFVDVLNFPKIPTSISARDLLIKLDNVSGFHIQNSVVPPATDKAPGKVTVYNQGMSQERIESKMAELRQICHFAIQNGYDELHFA